MREYGGAGNPLNRSLNRLGADTALAPSRRRERHAQNRAEPRLNFRGTPAIPRLCRAKLRQTHGRALHKLDQTSAEVGRAGHSIDRAQRRWVMLGRT